MCGLLVIGGKATQARTYQNSVILSKDPLVSILSVSNRYLVFLLGLQLQQMTQLLSRVANPFFLTERVVQGHGNGLYSYVEKDYAVWRVRAIAPGFIFGWRAFSSVSLCKSIGPSWFFL
jgi:hypothetical protein